MNVMGVAVVVVVVEAIRQVDYRGCTNFNS
jgi:hypothetical protein